MNGEMGLAMTGQKTPPYSKNSHIIFPPYRKNSKNTDWTQISKDGFVDTFFFNSVNCEDGEAWTSTQVTTREPTTTEPAR